MLTCSHTRWETHTAGETAYPETADLTIFVLSQVIDHLYVTAGELICGGLERWTRAGLQKMQ